ncbi:MAG: transcriptional repressor [Chloroflexi bacterium]|jgi:Fur family ferric uptake transcriptional regulator|nr:transcriptional repressor [Chloroflexota bacterium]
MKASSVDQIIIEFLQQNRQHYASHQIYEQIKIRLPAVNRSTVYRSLERLTNQGKISVSDMGTGVLLYEYVGEGRHHHLVCQECHHIIDISDEDVAPLFERIERKNSYEILTNHLILYGICPGCQTKPGS